MSLMSTQSTSGSSAAGDLRQSNYQELKERIHRTLLNRLNLDRLNRVGRAQAEPEIRGLIVSLLDVEKTSMPNNPAFAASFGFATSPAASRAHSSNASASRL